MAEKNHQNDGIFQPELDFGTDFTPNVPPTKISQPLGPVIDLAAIWDELPPPMQKVPLEAKDSDDPFYIAQLRAKELESLSPYIDDVPVLVPGLPFDQDETASSELMGLRAQEELNRIIPTGIRNNRLALSTFMLTALIPPELRQFHYRDNEEVLVSGLFKEFIFDDYENNKTLIIPLYQPKILEPRYFRDLEIASIKLPVLGVGDWEYDKTA